MHHTRSSKHRLILSLLSLGALLGMLTLSISLQQHPSKAHAAGAGVASDGPQFHLVGPKQHYLALGDSLAFGYQPNGVYTHGYVPDLFQILQNEGTKDVTNYGCGGETSTTFINGGCPAPGAPPPPYTQLGAAVAFLQAHAGKVSPVTLDIGGNDVLHDTNPSTCTVNVSGFYAHLATLDSNLTGIILPALLGALTVEGRVTGSIVMMNYYDPLQNFCPNTVQYTQILNAHLAADVSGFGIIVDVFGAFGGDTTQNPNICTYTWICFGDIHPTDLGYSLIADTFAAAIPSD
jgi:lysophospholipase L1-like esterase